MTLALPIDHVVVLVDDLAAAGAAFAQAGFQVTPETRHSAAMGTANRCVMLDGSYIELMGIVAETEANLTWRRLLAEGPGLRGIAFASEDINAAAGGLARSGIAAGPVRHFSRATEAAELRFSVVRIEPDETPGLQCLVCQHHSRDVLWQPALMRHPNGATGLTGITVPQADALTRFAVESGVTTSTGTANLTITATTAARYDLRDTCGLTIEMVTA
ncbi:Glyoxalase-like domain-containing protein [Bosea sp. CRIB-10]|uniref:VOC family protein n=1 Tax=Bosea sp. CRIB-10 TaxID=378404 RepID=UPI0008E6C5B4|nr:VOC family protein [Bosea sp. CRIB-10]SFC56628.1 Glyoxalase-like domain-containing protein [Bosea sp. CRIB-10]